MKGVALILNGGGGSCEGQRIGRVCDGFWYRDVFGCWSESGDHGLLIKGDLDPDDIDTVFSTEIMHGRGG